MGKKKGLPTRLDISKEQNDMIAANLMRSKKKVNADTIIRKNIHNLIIGLIKQNKGKISILKELQNEFPNTKYSVYFGDWIDYHMEKEIKPIYKSNDEGR